MHARDPLPSGKDLGLLFRGLLSLWILASAAACGDEDVRTGFVLELAPTPAADCDDAASDSVLPENACLRISLCRQDSGGCESVPLATIDGDHGDGVSEILLPVGASRRVEFDAKITDLAADHELDVVLYDGAGQPLAEGVLTGASFKEREPRIRLYRYAQASCAGPLVTDEGNEMSAPRAFHEATPLPNGDVLLYGGVRGEAVAESPTIGATLQPLVEVYRISEERFFPVETHGDFARVLFTSRLLPTDGGGTYRIRVSGGFEVAGSAAVLLLDGAQTGNPFAVPVFPSAAATPAPDVTLRYDPAALTLDVDTVNLMLPTGAGGNASADFGPAGQAPVVLGITGADTDHTLSFAGKYWFMGSDGNLVQERALGAPRYGASVTRFPETDTYLVWGGAITSVSAAAGDVRLNAGELLWPTEAAHGVTGVFPAPVAFHAASPILGGILVSGGLLVGCTTETECAQPLLTTFLDAAAPGGGSALHVFKHSRADTVVAASVAGGLYEPSVFHTSTPVDGSVMLVGGAHSPSMERKLTPSRQVLRVEPSGGGYEVGRPRPGFTQGLIRARWGHAAVEVSGCSSSDAGCRDRRLLVTGGFEFSGGGSGNTFRAIQTAEMLHFGPSARAIAPGCSEILEMDAGMDGGSMDAGPGPDSGPPDTGMPDDTGMPADASSDAAPSDGAPASGDGG